MTNQTEIRNSLGGSPAGVVFSRLCTLTLAAILATGGAVAGFAQDKPDAAKPAQPVSEKKPAPEPAAKISHGYMIHQSLEVGGRFTTISGSTAMWDTLVNQGSGGRILGQSLEMHSVDPSKTPFFDTLTTYTTSRAPSGGIVIISTTTCWTARCCLQPRRRIRFWCRNRTRFTYSTRCGATLTPP